MKSNIPLHEKISIMKAAERGHHIQKIHLLGGSGEKWEDISLKYIGWDWVHFRYRVRPTEDWIYRDACSSVAG